MKEVNKENFDEIVINSTKPVVVDFWAPWCGPCRMVGPILETISTENTTVEIVKCNVDENPELAQRFMIRGIPTVLFFKEGQIKDILVGAAPKTTYTEKINKLFS